MSFVNSIQTIIRKSNGNILNFYVKDQILFYREFILNNGWEAPKELFQDIKHNQFDIKIDNNDRIYGVAHTKYGEVIYIYTKNNTLYNKKLFEYDTKKYFMKYPYILKINSKIHILYYLQNRSNKKFWGIINHYYKGNNWLQNNISITKAYPILNPFIVSTEDENLSIFYFSKIKDIEEIFAIKFDALSMSWSNPQQITNTNNKKLYINASCNSLNSHDITWSEFVNNNLVIKYMNCSYKNSIFNPSKIKSLSLPSNCSFPTLLKTGNTLWNVWVEMDKLVSCYSIDNGNTWSEPEVDTASRNINFIRYKFDTNHKDDLINFKVNSIFGTYYPKISFIGFKNYQPSDK